MVTAATQYMSLLGPQGLAKVAANSHANIEALADKLAAIPGVTRAFASPFFHEVVLKLNDDTLKGTSARDVLRALRAQGILGGLALVMEKIGRVIGKIVGAFFAGGRQAVNMLVTNILPFLIFLSFIQGVMTSTGFGNWIANGLSVFTGSLIGIVLFALIIGIPVLSPLLGPGAAVQSVLGTLIGAQIAAGIVPLSLALPALFAISVVDGADFIPVACSLGEAEPETARVAVPAVLFSRFITAPLAVLIGALFSIGLFK
ncbi:PTS system glucitol/sorbitol-specific EIIB component [bioreactor metagenome]|uniref:PTS system glucitol/sorbitol-specific EIIB component n=1 Tax=bioreactor metagenome TaxID=1076179 RepID=A0A644YVG6_9ZZZZ